MIDVRSHRPFIEKLLARYGVPPDHLLVVDDVFTWCKENGVAEDWPFRAAKCFYSASECRIVLNAFQSDEQIVGALDHMRQAGFTQVSTLSTDEQYLAHLVLHEVSAFVLQHSDQARRDTWAFEELATLNAA